MRILTICYEYPPVGGGGGVVAAALAREFVAQGHDVAVVTSRLPGQPAFSDDRGVQVHRHRCRRRRWDYTTAAELLSTLGPAYRMAAARVRQARPDLLHAHFALPSGAVAWLLARRYGIPYVLTVHGSDVPGYNPDRFGFMHELARPLWRIILRDAAAVTSPSVYLADLVRRQARVPIRIVPNGHDAPTTAPRPKRDLVLVVARLFPRKGVQHFLEAVRDFGTDWEFVVAGDGPYLPELRALAARIQAPVRFSGFVDRAGLDVLYGEARILVVPSVQENFPMVLLEGMHAGCAVVTTSAEGCAEVIGTAGLIVRPGVPMELTEALRRLIDDPAACAALGERGRARAALFGWPRIAALYVDGFREVLHRAPEGLRQPE